MKGDEQRMRAGGCAGYVAKPIRYQVLLQTVDEVLAQHPVTTKHN
jgi:two-component system cell cycle response regulator DivK